MTVTWRRRREMSTWRRRREMSSLCAGSGRSLRVRAWLVTLAAVPLLGAAWLAYGELTHVVESRQDVAAIGESVDDLVDLSGLRSSILDERNWSSLSPGVGEIGLNVSPVEAMRGVDLGAFRGTAEAAVDYYLVKIGWPELESELVELRTVSDAAVSSISSGYERVAAVSSISSGYERVAASVEQRFGESLDESLTIAARIDRGPDLARDLRVLAAASKARHELTLHLTPYFGAQLSGFAGSFNDLF